MTGTVRVGIDGTSWANRRGFGRFARNAVSRLIEADPDTRYVVYLAGGARPPDLPAGIDCRVVGDGTIATEAPAAESRRRFADLLRLGSAAARDRLDAFLFPSVYSYFPVPGAPTVVGVHDTIAADLPDLTLPNRRSRVFWRSKERLAVHSASKLFTVSVVSRAAVATRFGIPTTRLAVVPEAPDPVFHPREPDSVRRALEPFGLAPDGYFVYSGGISPHKNIETLIEAFARRPDRNGSPKLVIVGDLDDDSYLCAARSVRTKVAEHGLGDHVLLPGFVSDEALACLLCGATAAVIPSLAEGFGLPAVEAAACGAPVLLSDLPAHRETLDKGALFFRPTDTEGLSAALGKVAVDAGLRSRLSERGRAAVARLTWDASADRLRTLIAAAAAEG